MGNNQSPCMTCDRVKDPGNCDNKCCKVWQEWFLKKWESYRRYGQIQMSKSGGKEN